MSALASEVAIDEVPKESRSSLEAVLDKSFEGLYLWHSKRTLHSIEVVRRATLAGREVGLAMLRMLERNLGYVYYVAVLPEFRGKGVGGALLDNSLKYFFEAGAEEVFAAVEEDNRESIALFSSRGFSEVDFSDLGKRFGRIHAARLWTKMVVVPGEILLSKRISAALKV